jgi:hypothetical protein
VVLDRGIRVGPPGSFPGIATSSSAMLFCAPRLRCFTLTLERWVSPEGVSLIGQLPAEIGGVHFGPQLRAFILYQYHHAHVTQPLLLEPLREWQIDISAGQLSALITDDHGEFHREKDALLQAGLQRSRASCKTLAGELLRRTIRSRGTIFFAREVSLAEGLTGWHDLPHSGRTPSCIPRMHSGRRGSAGGHRRNRINWSADSARRPNIRWAITLVWPLTRMFRPPNSSLRRALLRSAALRSL